MSGSGPSGTGSAVSVPSYRRWTRRTVLAVPGSMPSSASSDRASAASRPATWSSSGSRAAVSGASTAVSRIAVTSARPIPYADSTPASGWISTRVMPSASATAHAC